MSDSRAAALFATSVLLASIVGGIGNVSHAQTAQGTPNDATSFRGDYCASDADCSWNDLCEPTRCVERSAVTTTDCEESLPEPGTCSCIDSQCTLRPSDSGWLGYSAGECGNNNGCVIEPAAAQCHSVEPAQAAALQGAIVLQGPHCTCGSESSHCQFGWSEPVLCTTSLDCGWSESGRLRPRPVSADSPRSGPREPCIDGEFDSVCVSGFCQLMFWEC